MFFFISRPPIGRQAETQKRKELRTQRACLIFILDQSSTYYFLSSFATWRLCVKQGCCLYLIDFM